MEVKSIKGIKFKDAVIPVKELKEWIKKQEKQRRKTLRKTLAWLRYYAKERDYFLFVLAAGDIIHDAGELILLEKLKKWVEKHERKE